MARPTIAPDWATNTNHAAGSDDWSGQPCKVQPSAGKVATGFIPDEGLPSEELNFILNNHGEWIEHLDGALGVGFFGSGADGAAVFDGSGAVTGASRSGSTYTLTRDVFYTDATFTGSAILKTAGYRIFINGTLSAPSGTSTIHNSSAGTKPGAPAGSVGGGGDGGNGGSNAPGGDGVSVAAVIGGAGGLGGDCSVASGGTNLGTAPTAANGGWKNIISAITGHAFGAGSLTLLRGGSGGGGGAGNGGAGGDGGGGGGIVVLCAKRIEWANLSVKAEGHSGNNKATGSDSGGGGGGGGGAIFIVCKEHTGSPSTSVAGGAGGSGDSAPHDGADGADGSVFIFELSGSGTTTGTHREQGVDAMSNTGSGDGVDYLDVTFNTAFASADYVYSYGAYSSDGDSVYLTLANVTTTGFRVIPSAPFNGTISWKAEEL